MQTHLRLETLKPTLSAYQTLGDLIGSLEEKDGGGLQGVTVLEALEDVSRDVRRALAVAEKIIDADEDQE